MAIVADPLTDAGSSTADKNRSDASDGSVSHGPTVRSQEASKWPQILAAVSTTIGSVGLGCGLGWTSPTLPNLVDCRNNTEKPDGCTFDNEFSENEGSWIGSSYTLGALVTGLVSGYIFTRIGRKPTMLIMAVPFIAGWLLLALTEPLALDEPLYFYIGRALAGFGAGSFALAAPLYTMEISQSSIRGALGILFQFMVTFGNIFVNGVGSVLPWETLTAICLAFPESPYLLLIKGKEKQARKNLQWLRGAHYDIEPEIQDMKQVHQSHVNVGKFGPWDLIRTPTYLKPLLIMLFLHFTQQFCGINAIVFYLADIFLNAGLNIDNSLAAAAVVSLTQLIATGTSIFLVERTGRKILLLFSSSIMSVSILALGVFFYLSAHEEVTCNEPENIGKPCQPEDGYSSHTLDALGWLPLVSLIIYKFAFSIGYGPLPWMMNGEFFPQEAKMVSSSIAVAFNWLCAFVVTNFVPDIQHAIGIHGMYFTFSIICGIASVFVLFLVPETRGKTPEDMKTYFQERTFARCACNF